MTTPEQSAAPAFKTRVFLWGADMSPIRIQERWPSGRFAGIACAAGMLTRGAGLPPGAFGPELWGVVVETGVEQRGVPLPLTLPDGASATAMLAGDPAGRGAPAEILAEANYWELPESYRDYLRTLVANQQEES